MSDLDALIARARTTTVDRAAAERYVRDLERRMQPAAPERRRLVWLVGDVASAALLVMVVLWGGKGGDVSQLGVPARAGDRVAVLADPDAIYSVTHIGADDTSIMVEGGAVTVRLWPGERPYHLVLSGGGVTATATGTVYTLAIRPSGPVVSVLEGTVEVREIRSAGVVHAVHARETWPPGSQATNPAAGHVLLAVSAPSELPLTVVASVDAGVPEDAGTTPASQDAGGPTDADVDAVRADARGVPDASAGIIIEPLHLPSEPTIKDRWRTARSLRAQGRLADAVAECQVIANAHDPTWSPIALVEAVRIELGPLGDSKRAIALAERMIREWPDNALASEARELRCRALRQLGRGDACAPTPQP